MQSTARAPAHLGAGYQRFAREAELVEAYGFHSLWTAEHRGWYDGWCPAPIHALAYAAAGTSRLRFGTAMLLLPQHGGDSVRAAADTFDRLYPGRLELGVGLGYRDPEFDALGLRRDRRGRLMDNALADLLAGRTGERVWVGGMADAALARAARFGCGILLPQTVPMRRLGTIIERHRQTGTGPVAVTQDVHVCENPDAFQHELRAHFREEIASWWPFRSKDGLASQTQVDNQLDRISRSAVAGPAWYVAERLDSLLQLGVDFLLLRLCFDFVASDRLAEQIDLVAEEVVPMLAARGEQY